MELTKFSEVLKQYREERDLTLDELAAMLGTSKQVLSRYENKQRSPKLVVAAAFAEKMGIPLESFVGDRPQPVLPDSLSQDEQHLVTLYRSLNPAGRQMAVTAVESFAANPALTEEARAGAS